MTMLDNIDTLSNRRSKVILRCDRESPIDQSVRIILAEKEANFEVYYHTEDDEESAAGYSADSSTNNIGSLRLIDRELELYNVHIIMEYVDDRYPYPPLHPSDPMDRARNRMLRHYIIKEICPALHNLEHGKKDQVIKAKEVLYEHLTDIAASLKHTDYFMSEDYSMIDCCIAPILWRLEKYELKLPRTITKLIVDYKKRLFKRIAFKSSLSDRYNAYDQLENIQ